MEKCTHAATPLNYMERIRKATDVVCPLLPKPSCDDRNQIARRIKTFETAMLANKSQFAVTVVCFLICLTEETMKQKSPQKTTVKALDKVNRALIALNKYYDKKLNNNDCYDAAHTLSVAWSKA